MIPAPHRHTFAEIDLAAIRRNLLRIKELIPKGTEVWPAVKANAYGHGVLELSSTLADLLDGFCVSNLDEAIELRESGLAHPILILSAITPQDAALARDLDLSLAATSLDWLELVAAEGQDLSGLKLQIAVDSGMGRIGIRDAAEANAMIERMDELGIDFEGIFTHFATADEKEQAKFESQQRNFAEILNQLVRRPRYVHSTNSAAALWHSEQVQDIERLGLALYGLNPSGTVLESPIELEPALSLYSELTHVKVIQAGDSVGYGATYQATEPTIIGTVPIGYADGWLRELQGFQLLVGGKFCEIVGRISMDQLTVKLDKAYPIGSRVTLIGKDGEQKITADDVASYRGTISYEVLTSLSDRIYRVYI